MINRLWLLPVVCLPAILFAQVRFSVSTERTKIAMGEQVAVVATLVTGKQVPNLAIPPVASNNEFTLLKTHSQQSTSSSIQIINGKASQKNEITTTFYYFIAPRQTGPFVFPALSIAIDGADYHTDPLTFTVLTEAVSNPDVRVFLTLSKRKLYPGEQALLTFKVAQRVQTQGSTDVRNGFNGALEKIEQGFGKNFTLTKLFTNQVTQSSERIDGEMYNVYSLRFLLFPLASGSYTVPAVPYEYQELRRAQRRAVDPFFDDFFGGGFFGGGTQAVPKTAFTSPLVIETLQLPPAPAGFNGAVGAFSLTAAAQPSEVPAGESVTLKVLLKGNTRPGSMSDITVPANDAYELFTPEKSMSVDTGESGISTRKTYKYLLIPKNEGLLTLPPITFTYFDPKSGSFATATSSPITISVTKGKGEKKEQTRYLTQEDIREIGRDIRYIKTAVVLKHQSRRPYRDPVLLLLFPLPLIGLLLALLYRFQSTRRDQNIALNLRNKALAAALKQMALLKKQISILSPGDFLGRISSTIEAYISNKFGFPATGRTLDELREELLRSTADQKTVDDLTGLIEQLDGYRFGGMTIDDASRLSIIDRAATFLTGLEKGSKKEKNSMKTAAILLAGCLLWNSAAGAPIEHWFEQGNKAYAEGRFDSAAVFYEQILESGTENAAVLYNYGNALYRLGKPGRARLAYEKAALLTPGDPEITANIRFLQSNIVDRAPEPDRGFIDTLLLKLHILIPLKLQLRIALILLSCMALFIALMLFASRNARLWLIYLSVLFGTVFVAIGSSIGIKIYESERVSYAVVLVPATDAKNEPKGSTVLFTAHEGTKFRIRKTVDNWSLVSLPNGVSGWVERDALGEI